MKIKLWAIIGEEDGVRKFARRRLEPLPVMYETKWEATWSLKEQLRRKELKMRVVRVNVTVEEER